MSAAAIVEPQSFTSRTEAAEWIKANRGGRGMVHESFSSRRGLRYLAIDFVDGAIVAFVTPDRVVELVDW